MAKTIIIPINKILPGDLPRELSWRQLHGQYYFDKPLNPDEYISYQDGVKILSFLKEDSIGKTPSVVTVEVNNEAFYMTTNATHRLAYFFKIMPDALVEIAIDDSPFNKFTAQMIRDDIQLPKTMQEFVQVADNYLNNGENDEIELK